MINCLIKFSASGGVNLDTIQAHCKLAHGLLDAYTQTVDDANQARAGLLLSERFVCDCPRTNTETDDLGLFIAECTPIAFKCQCCRICFPNLGQLCHHLRLAGHSFFCNLCNYASTTSLDKFTDHFYQNHKKGPYDVVTQPDYRCIVCHRDLESLDSLANHLSQVHHIRPDDTILEHTIKQCQVLEIVQASSLMLVHRKFKLPELDSSHLSGIIALATQILESRKDLANHPAVKRLECRLGKCPVCMEFEYGSDCSCDEYGMLDTNSGSRGTSLNPHGIRSLLFNMHSIVESQCTNESSETVLRSIAFLLPFRDDVTI